VFPVPQTRIEKVLNERVAELDVTIHRGNKLVGLTQRDDHVELDIHTPTGTERMSVGSWASTSRSNLPTGRDHTG
jgi:2-polyprenyl-6-methoxyphenol hydroxylase-like FAD-dependent oxidoreductase